MLSFEKVLEGHPLKEQWIPSASHFERLGLSVDNFLVSIGRSEVGGEGGKPGSQETLLFRFVFGVLAAGWDLATSNKVLEVLLEDTKDYKKLLARTPDFLSVLAKNEHEGLMHILSECSRAGESGGELAFNPPLS